MIDYLLKPKNLINNEYVKRFLNKFVLVIVPMLNPDGVIQGHTVLDSNGENLDDRYLNGDYNETPTIFALKSLVQHISSNYELYCYFDIHAHSTRRGVTFFGDLIDEKNYFNVLLMPYMFSFHQRDYRLHKSHFGSDKDSKSRTAFYDKLGLGNLYTINVNYWGGSVSMEFLKANRLIFETILDNRVRVVKNTAKFYDIKYFNRLGINLLKAIVESHDLMYKKTDKFQKIRNMIEKDLEKFIHLNKQKIYKFKDHMTLNTNKIIKKIYDKIDDSDGKNDMNKQHLLQLQKLKAQVLQDDNEQLEFVEDSSDAFDNFE